MADNERTYEYRTVRAIRGTEARTEAKWVRDGWEVVDHVPGKLRTELKLRKARTKLSKRVIGLVAVGVLGLSAVVGVMAALGGRDGSSDTAGPAERESVQAESTSPSPSEEPAPGASEEAAPAMITVENNADFAALLANGDTCSDSIAAFADKYDGATLRFEGNISYMNAHESYETRHDLLIGAGDYSETSSPGPAFQFRDVAAYDLRFAGDDIPDGYGAGDNLLITAEVDEFIAQQCLFLLNPVETRFR